MAKAANRTASIYTRVDPETKDRAENILNQLGIPMTNAIAMFLKQVVIQRGIPFELRLPDSAPEEEGEQGEAEKAAEALDIP